MDHSVIFHKNGVALDGYDVVAYFEEGVDVKGRSKYSFRWNGLEWRFSNKIYLKVFAEDPEKYLPQFGGYCAFGASQGYKASVRPSAFYFHKGRLYFNFAKYVRKRWLEDLENKVEEAETKWPKIKETKPIKARPIPIWWKYRILKLLGKDLFK